MKIKLLFILLITIVLFNSVCFASGNGAVDSSKYVVTEDERFNKIFREGRDLIDKEDWKNAAAKFNEIVCDCPENKGVDAAFYWLAFCYKKLNNFKQMDETIDRLLRNFPTSSWADDARVMKFDRPARATTYSSTATSTNVFPASTGSIDAAVFLSTGSSQTPLDRDDEMKLAAFQSLKAADPERALAVLENLVRTDSKASEALKLSVLRNLNSSNLFYLQGLDSTAAFEPASNKENSRLLPFVRETLQKSYRNESNVRVKTAIIYALANLNDDESMNNLIRLYSSENDAMLKKAIINSFGMYTMFNGFFPASSGSGSPKTDRESSRIKLIEIIRSEKDIELRRLALSNLQRFSGWAQKDGVIEMLIQIYDSETNDEFRSTIIRSLGSAKQKTAAAKLLNIAKNDKSDLMRLEAIRSLRTSNDPEILKFLEDLIK